MLWLTPVLALLGAASVVLNFSLASLAKEELQKRNIEPGWLTKKLATQWERYEAEVGNFSNTSSRSLSKFLRMARGRLINLIIAIVALFTLFWVGPTLVLALLSVLW